MRYDFWFQNRNQNRDKKLVTMDNFTSRVLLRKEEILTPKFQTTFEQIPPSLNIYFRFHKKDNNFFWLWLQAAARILNFLIQKKHESEHREETSPTSDNSQIWALLRKTETLTP